MLRFPPSEQLLCHHSTTILLHIILRATTSFDHRLQLLFMNFRHCLHCGSLHQCVYACIIAPVQSQASSMLKPCKAKLCVAREADVAFLEGVLENFLVARGSRDLKGLLEAPVHKLHHAVCACENDSSQQPAQTPSTLHHQPACLAAACRSIQC